MIYLATPYTHSDPNVIEERFQRVTKVAGKLLENGEVVFSPITHCHEIAKLHNLPTNWEWWMKIDREYLSKCKVLYILTLDGWENSKGVNAEIALAKEFGLDIHLVDEYLNLTMYWKYEPLLPEPMVYGNHPSISLIKREQDGPSKGWYIVAHNSKVEKVRLTYDESKKLVTIEFEKRGNGFDFDPHTFNSTAWTQGEWQVCDPQFLPYEAQQDENSSSN